MLIIMFGVNFAKFEIDREIQELSPIMIFKNFVQDWLKFKIEKKFAGFNLFIFVKNGSFANSHRRSHLQEKPKFIFLESLGIKFESNQCINCDRQKNLFLKVLVRS